MSQREHPRPVGELLVRYSAEQMPTSAIVDIQRRTLVDHETGQLNTKDCLRIVNLLLTISLQKLTATA